MRRFLAKLLYPKIFEEEDKANFLLRRLDELQHWCGKEAPEINYAVVWLKKAFDVNFMPLVEYDQRVKSGELPHVSAPGIEGFCAEMHARMKHVATNERLTEGA